MEKMYILSYLNQVVTMVVCFIRFSIDIGFPS